MATSTFRTPAGVPVPAVSATQMAEVDRVAVEEVGPNLFQMMENAGRSLAATVLDLEPSGPVVVLAGTGGNGGGGICAARHLANRGVDVTVVVSHPSRLGVVPAAQLDVFRATSGREATVADLDRLTPAVVVDAVVGYSLRGAPHGAAAELIAWADVQDVPVVSLDVPSGVDATSGEAPGVHVSAAVTLTLALPKTGLDVPAVGVLWLADLGIPAEVFHRVGVDVPPDLFGPAFRVPLTPVPASRGGPAR